MRRPTSARRSDRTMREFNILNTDRQLSALQTAASMLQALPEQKSLVYFASGLRLNGVDNQAQLRATVNASIRANVSIYPVDARGLVAEAPLGDATRASPGGHLHYSPARLANTAHDRLSAFAGHAVQPGERHRRQGALRQQRSVPGDRAGGELDRQLLHHRIHQHPSSKGRQVPSRQGRADRRTVGRPVVSPGLFRRQGVREVHGCGQGAPARRGAHAGEPGHRHHHRHGSELLPAQSRRVLRPGGGKDSRQRSGPGQAGRRGPHARSTSSAR